MILVYKRSILMYRMTREETPLETSLCQNEYIMCTFLNIGDHRRTQSRNTLQGDELFDKW